VGVIEAMSCGCTPVITERGALPEVVGNIGYYVPYGNEKATVEAIKRALNVDTGLRKRARNRIEKEFSMKMREKELSELMRMLVTEEKHV
jgi:glycosyltransferase involved in cell wall biosynthesis